MSDHSGRFKFRNDYNEKRYSNNMSPKIKNLNTSGLKSQHGAIDNSRVLAQTNRATGSESQSNGKGTYLKPEF